MMKIKMIKARLSLAFITLIATTSALAGTDNIFGSWTNIQLTGNFNEKFRWFLMDEVRTRDDEHLANPGAGFSPRFSQNLVWASVGYNLTEHTSVWLGYSHIWNKRLNGTHNSISRPYQDFLWTSPIGGGFTATMRSRLEEIITVSGAGASSSLGDVGIRIRQLAAISHPISAVQGLSWYLANEGWFFLNDFGGNQGGFDQTRPMLGLIYQATRHLNLQLGYLGQYIHSQSGGDDLFTHNVQFATIFKF